MTPEIPIVHAAAKCADSAGVRQILKRLSAHHSARPALKTTKRRPAQWRARRSAGAAYSRCRRLRAALRPNPAALDSEGAFDTANATGARRKGCRHACDLLIPRLGGGVASASGSWPL